MSKMHVCICAGWLCVSAPRPLLCGQWPADPVRSAQEESPRGVFQAADRDDVQQTTIRNTSLYRYALWIFSLTPAFYDPMLILCSIDNKEQRLLQK